jgi:hypothetical protein
VSPTIADKEGQSGPCGTQRCHSCTVIHLTNTFTSRIGTKTSLIEIVNCETANVIYLISGKVCNKPGVGDTKLPSCYPINLHRSKEYEDVTYS